MEVDGEIPPIDFERVELNLSRKKGFLFFSFSFLGLLSFYFFPFWDLMQFFYFLFRVVFLFPFSFSFSFTFSSFFPPFFWDHFLLLIPSFFLLPLSLFPYLAFISYLGLGLLALNDLKPAELMFSLHPDENRWYLLFTKMRMVEAAPSPAGFQEIIDLLQTKTFPAYESSSKFLQIPPNSSKLL